MIRVRGIWQIALFVALYSVTSAMLFPVVQSMIYHKLCVQHWREAGLEEGGCANPGVASSNQVLQTLANAIMQYGTISMTLIAIITSTLLGRLGDSLSRKLAIAIPVCGLVLADIPLLVLAATPDDLTASAYLFVVSEVIFGLTGSVAAMFSGAFAYANHTAKSNGVERAHTMAILEGAIGVGSIIGYLLTSSVRRFGYTTAFIFITVIHVACLIVVLTLTDIKPTRSALEYDSRPRLTVFRALKEKLTSWTQLFNDPKSRTSLIILIVAYSTSYVTVIGTFQILFYYLKVRFAWDTELYGYLKAPLQLMATISILVLFPFFKTKGISDPYLALIGLFSKLLCNLWLSVVWDTASVFALIAFDSFSRFSAAALRSMISKSAAENEQGRIFSLMSVTELVGTLVSSAVFQRLFPLSIGFFPQLCFVIMAGLLVPAILAVAINRRHLAEISAGLPPVGKEAVEEVAEESLPSLAIDSDTERHAATDK